jgi:hypothetical protein
MVFMKFGFCGKQISQNVEKNIGLEHWLSGKL